MYSLIPKLKSLDGCNVCLETFKVWHSQLGVYLGERTPSRVVEEVERSHDPESPYALAMFGDFSGPLVLEAELESDAVPDSEFDCSCAKIVFTIKDPANALAAIRECIENINWRDYAKGANF